MASKRALQQDRRESPIQFRPGIDLFQLIADFAAAHDMEVNEASKCLVALAVIELDARFYKLVNEMAETMGGTNAFSRSCVHIKTAMQTANRLRPETALSESDRIRFILDTITAYLAEKGHTRQTRSPWDPVEELAREETSRPSGPSRARRVISEKIRKAGEQERSFSATERPPDMA